MRYGQCVEDAEIWAKLKQGSGYADLPGRHITVNQVVAWNLAYFRKAAGLTQDELGERIGWSKAIVSAAERSLDGKRVRQFSADDIVTIATALGVPVVAMFLPPEDDGVELRYLIDLPVHTYGTGAVVNMCHTMHDLMAFVVPEELARSDGEPDDRASDDDDSEALRRYWHRYIGSINGYLRADRVGELIDYREDLTTEERIVEHLARLRGQYDALREMISDNDHLQAALNDKLLATRGGRGVSPVDRRSPERREWDARVAEVAKEMYGRANLTRAEVSMAITEAKRRGFAEPPYEKWFVSDDEANSADGAP